MKHGFTLVEILIAIAIIGVITVLTLPSVTSGVNQKANVKLLETASQAVNMATKQVMMDERVTNLADTVYGTNAGAFLQNYFRLSLYCGNSYTDCLASSYKSLSGSASATTASMLSGKTFYCGATQSGTVICITNMTTDSGDTHGSSTAVIDVNGKKGPNKNGQDLFSFNVYTDGRIGNQYVASSNDADGTTCNNYRNTAGYGGACYSKVVADNWQIKY